MNQPLNNELLLIGKIISAHGIHGELKVQVLADNPKIFRNGLSIYYCNNEHQLVKCQVLKTQTSGKLILLELQDIQDRTSAETLAGSLVYIHPGDLPELTEGVYYCHQLIGLDARLKNGDIIGKVVDVLSYPAHDQYVIELANGKQFMLPAMKEFIVEIDLQIKKLTIDPPEGLIELV
jgi:16S rRNA processing protein RimM